MRKRFLIITAIAAAATMPLGACSRQYEEAGDVSPTAAVNVHIKNENFLDMDVFAVMDGVSTRVGTVTGNGSRDFTISSAYANRDVRLIATPIGGSGRATTGSLNVGRGQTIDFRIGSTLANSTTVIR